MSNLRGNWNSLGYWYELFFVKFPRHLRKGQSIVDMIKEEVGERDEFG